MTAVSMRLHLERELRERLRGHRLVGELDLEGDLYARVEKIVREVASSGPQVLDRLGTQYPAMHAVYLVGQGAHNWHGLAGFWGNLSVEGFRPQVAGPQFEAALRTLELETFDALVEAERAHRYVARILIHGGIPSYSVPDFFRLVLHDLKQGATDAADLISVWRTRRTRFVGIDRPVERFLLHGGDLAVDFLNRCIDMIREETRTGAVPDHEELGLPAYVVKRYAELPPEERRTSIAAPGLPVARLMMDPWDAFGPYLELPPVPSHVLGGNWRIDSGTAIREEPAVHDRSRTHRVEPSLAWHVTLMADYRSLRRFTFHGPTEELPAMFFTPSTGRVVTDPEELRLETVIAAHPRDVTLAGGKGEIGLSVIEEMPDPAGRWSGYVRREYDLRGETSIILRRGPVRRRIRVLSPGAQSRLVGEPLNGIATADGLPIYATAPHLSVPVRAEIPLSRWQLRLRRGEASMTAGLDTMPRSGSGLFEMGDMLPRTADGMGIYSLTLRGPLGSDLRAEFALVPGLHVEVPTLVLLPGDQAPPVVVTAPGYGVGDLEDRIEIVASPEQDQLPIQLRREGEDLELAISLPRLVWTIDRLDRPGAVLDSEINAVSGEDIETGLASAITVRTRRPDLPVQLRLTTGSSTLQESAWERTAGPLGGWSFDLKPFSDTIRASDEPELALVLLIADRRVTLARVLAHLEVENIRSAWEVSGWMATVNVTFDENRPFRGRVVRLWPLDRPWEEPLVQAVPDGEAGGVGIATPVIAGPYRIEVAIDEGWGPAPARPARLARNCVVEFIGDPAARDERMGHLDLAHPAGVLEAAAWSQRPLRPLTDEEIQQVAGAGLTLILSLFEERGSRVLRDRAFQRTAELLTERPEPLLRFMSTAYAAPGMLLRAAIALYGSIDWSSLDMQADDVLALWANCPVSAAAMDAPRASVDTASAARSEERTGWTAGEPLEPRGGPVPRPLAEMSAAQVGLFSEALVLVPVRLLDPDTRARANIEWLIRRFDDPNRITDWLWRYRELADSLTTLPKWAVPHLENRARDPATPRWTEVPQVTLAAALHLVTGSVDRDAAAAALIEACAFAERLVLHDLVLAPIISAEAP